MHALFPTLPSQCTYFTCEYSNTVMAHFVTLMNFDKFMLVTSGKLKKNNFTWNFTPELFATVWN